MFAAKRWFFLSQIFLVLQCASPARAMVVAKRDFADLVERAEQIVVGTVIAISPGTTPAGAPITRVTFGDLSVLKGSVGSTLTLDLYGGVEGDVASRIPDMPQFSEGERDIVFVAGNGRDVCPLVGVWQGRFRVRFDSERGTEVVEAQNGSAVVGRERRELRFAPPSAGTATMTLDAFRALVADELANPTAQSTGHP